MQPNSDDQSHSAAGFQGQSRQNRIKINNDQCQYLAGGLNISRNSGIFSQGEISAV